MNIYFQALILYQEQHSSYIKNNIHLKSTITMGTLDWLVIGAFVLALVGIIVWVVRQKQKDSADYFLGGRDATWIAIGASIFASNIGSEHLIGLAGAGASSGMAMAHWEIQGWMILLLGWVFVPFYARSMVYTMPEFLERRYNPQSRTILSVISLISYVLTKVAVTVYAGGLVFQQVFGIETLWGIDFFWIAAIGQAAMVVIVVSLMTPAPDRNRIQGLVFGTATPEQRAETRASWNGWDILHTVVILAITMLFYVYFW